ncbi:MAG: hypothetical protein P1P76_11715 [Anaerolineales bacterium]|nr:hypothetical protein [Anaerolineales bacterium]
MMINQKIALRFARVAVVVLLASLIPVANLSAAPPYDPPEPIGPPEFARKAVAAARLTEINGERSIRLIPALVEAVEVSPNAYQLTYEVGIPKNLLDPEDSSPQTFEVFPFSVSAGSDSHNGCDSTVSVCALLTLYYTDLGDHGYYQKTTNRWTRYDSTVTWSGAMLQAGCSANWYQKSGTCNTITTRNIGTPTSGTTYSYTPWFAGSANQVYLNDLNGIAAFQSITLKRGASTWQFSFCVNYEGDERILGCY